MSKRIFILEFLNVCARACVCTHVKDRRGKEQILLELFNESIVIPPLCLWLMMWSDMKNFVSFVGSKRKE